jgi:DNA-binding LacI/PurR family transcriptional regulator
LKFVSVFTYNDVKRLTIRYQIWGAVSLKKITIKDVAKHAGVSIATVSYVLNGKEHKVSTDMIIKIRESIKKLNYIPSFSARSLVNNSSKLIGVVIPQTENFKQLLLENPFYSEVVSGIEAEARRCGYHLILAGVDKEESYFDISVQRNLDGAIITGIYAEQFYDEFKQIKIPIVLVDSYVNDTYFQKVGIDDELGGYIATKHLIDCGHRNIALVTGTIKKDGVVEKRFLGYKRAFKEANLFYKPEYVYEDSVSYEYGVVAGKLIAEKHPEITAVFATSDMVALGVINGLTDCGKSVPDDVSIIGFDDIPISRVFIPKLTTIKQDITLKGIKAAQCLIEVMGGKSTGQPHDIILPIKLIERHTVKKLTQG